MCLQRECGEKKKKGVNTLTIYLFSCLYCVRMIIDMPTLPPSGIQWWHQMVEDVPKCHAWRLGIYKIPQLECCYHSSIWGSYSDFPFFCSVFCSFLSFLIRYVVFIIYCRLPFFSPATYILQLCRGKQMWKCLFPIDSFPIASNCSNSNFLLISHMITKQNCHGSILILGSCRNIIL